MSRLLRFLENQPKIWLWVEVLALTAIVGTIDFRTGYEVSVVLFYSLPIVLMVWFGDRKSAVLIALFSAIIWWWADQASGHSYSEEWFHIWETSVRLTYFLLFVLGGTALKSRIGLLEHNQRLEQEILRISEREQLRIGQDLHDGLCQFYAAVGCAAGSLKCNLQKQGSSAASSAAEIEELIMDGVGQTRSLARGLFPVHDEERGLESALEELAASSRRLMKIDCTFEHDEAVPSFPLASATNLYRIAQEALHNATRHGSTKGRS